MTFHRILAAVDFSAESLSAFRVAVELARLDSAQLLIFHVTEAVPTVAELNAIDGLGEAALEIEEKARAAMERLIKSSKSDLADVPFTSEMNTGTASIEIERRAKEWGADLIVLGSKGAPRLERLVMGSTADGVMRHARCSVLVVKPPRDRAAP